MSQPYVGEIRIFAGNFAPAGWAYCNGSLLPISENETLFNLIGTTFGGDGQSTFAVPDLRGRLPMHAGGGHVLGETAGTETVTLAVNQMPAHTHAPAAKSGPGDQASPAGRVWAASRSGSYVPTAAAPTLAQMKTSSGGPALASAGGSQPHTNLMPYVSVNYIISLFGIFPSPT